MVTPGVIETLVRTLQRRRMAELPALADAEDLVALNATVDGRLVAVSARGSRRNGLPDLRARVHLHEAGGDWRAVALTDVTIVPNEVDLLPDGSLLLVQSGCVRRPFEPVPHNAQVLNASGQALRSFRIGDGVRHPSRAAWPLDGRPLMAPDRDRRRQ
jgi:hypothetical protein